MNKYEYTTEIIEGKFRLRLFKTRDAKNLCNKLGQKGWELAGYDYSFFVGEYTLFFKRKIVSK